MSENDKKNNKEERSQALQRELLLLQLRNSGTIPPVGKNPEKPKKPSENSNGHLR